MFTRKKKIGSDLGVAKSGNRLLRLLRSDMGSQASLMSSAKAEREDAYGEAQKEITNAMLEAEYERAKAVMATQQHRNFY